MLNADVDFHVLEQVIPEGSVRHVAGTCKGHGPTIHRCGTQEALAEQLVDVENKATLYQTARVGSARAARNPTARAERATSGDKKAECSGTSSSGLFRPESRAFYSSTPLKTSYGGPT